MYHRVAVDNSWLITIIQRDIVFGKYVGACAECDGILYSRNSANITMCIDRNIQLYQRTSWDSDAIFPPLIEMSLLNNLQEGEKREDSCQTRGWRIQFFDMKKSECWVCLWWRSLTWTVREQEVLRGGRPLSVAVTVRAYTACSEWLSGDDERSSPVFVFKEKRSALGPVTDKKFYVTWCVWEGWIHKPEVIRIVFHSIYLYPNNDDIFIFIKTTNRMQ